MVNDSNSQKEFYSCYFVENALILHPYQLFHCCIPVNGKFGSTLIAEYYGGPLPVEAIRHSRDLYRKAIETENPKFHCYGCPYRKLEKWNTEYLFTNIHFNHSLLCNLNCQFCVQRPGPIEDKTPRYMALPVVQSLVSGRLLSPNAYIFWAGGEPTFLPDFEESLNLMVSYGTTLNEIATNATILSNAILRNLGPNGRVTLKTSVDCGTRETFHRLKQNDLFDKVWEHLGAYAATGGSVGAKYIISKDNYQKRELDGFIDHALRFGLRSAYIDIDHNVPATSVNAQQIAAAAYLYRGLAAAGINVRCGVHSGGSMPDFSKLVEAFDVSKYADCGSIAAM
jgi:sulfatase maturation enzyme AslB (radical SAM superfamily)